MRLALINREKLHALGAALVGEFDNLVARIRAGWGVEHSEDGRHGEVHAATISTGRVVFADIVSDAINQSVVNNYHPNIETASLLRLTSSLAEVTISGLQVPQDAQGAVLDGRMLIVENVSVSGTVIRLVDQSSGEGQQSFARNRFHIPRGPAPSNATNVFLIHPTTLVTLVYNAQRSLWIVMSQSNENTVGFTAFSSAQHNLEVSGSYRTIRTWRVVPEAVDLVISGFNAALIPASEKKTLVNDGVFTVAILHANTGSLAPNRVYCPGGARYLLHPREAVELQRIATGGWRMLSKADQWIDVIAEVGLFVSDPGSTWSLPTMTTLCYQADGNSMTLAYVLPDWTLTGAGSATLRIRIPDGRVAARDIRQRCAQAYDGTGGAVESFARTVPGDSYVHFYHDQFAGPWPVTAGASTGYLSGEITFMVGEACNVIVEAHTDVAHADAGHGDAEHGDVIHVDAGHVDSHSDTAHADSSHTDLAHTDAHTDTAHTDTHGDSAHQDVGHVDFSHSDTHDDDAHDDVTHQDDPHDDVPFDDHHIDSHGDVQHDDFHSDVGHEDFHSDQPHMDEHDDHYDDIFHDDLFHLEDHGDAHGDTTFDDQHFDAEHGDFHNDAHTDQGHEDDAHDDVTHQDDPHDDTHGDLAHADTPHADAGHSDAHSDVTHVDTHSDGAHGDAAHSDTGHTDSHSDVPHGDALHTDAGHTDTSHGDSSHQDVGMHCDEIHADM